MSGTFSFRMIVLAAMVVGSLLLVSTKSLTSANLTAADEVNDLKRLISPSGASVQTATGNRASVNNSSSANREELRKSSQEGGKNSNNNSSKSGKNNGKEPLQLEGLASANHNLRMLPQAGSLLPSMMDFGASVGRFKALPRGARRLDEDASLNVAPSSSARLAHDDLLLASSGGQLIGDKFVLPSDDERRRVEELVLAASRPAKRRSSSSSFGGAGDNFASPDLYGKIVDDGQSDSTLDTERTRRRSKLSDELIDANENYNRLAMQSARSRQRSMTQSMGRRMAVGQSSVGLQQAHRRAHNGQAQFERRQAGPGLLSGRRAQGAGGSQRRQSGGRATRGGADGSDSEQDELGDDEDEESAASAKRAHRRRSSESEADEEDDDEVEEGEQRAGAAQRRRASSSDQLGKLHRAQQAANVDETDEEDGASESVLARRVGGSYSGAGRQSEDIIDDNSANYKVDPELIGSTLALEGEKESSESKTQAEAAAAAAAVLASSQAHQQRHSAAATLKYKAQDLHAAAGHHHGHHPHYYQYVEVPKKKTWKYGFKRGNHKHEIEKHEKGHKHKFHTTFKWHAKEKCKKKSKCKSVGKMVWEYKHHKKEHHP